MKIAINIVLLFTISSFFLDGQAVVTTDYINLLSSKNEGLYSIDDDKRKDLYAARPSSFQTLVPMEGLLVPTTFNKVNLFSNDLQISVASGATTSMIDQPISYRSDAGHMSILTLNSERMSINYNNNATDYVLEQLPSGELKQMVIHENDPIEVGCATSDEGADTYVKLRENYKTSEPVDLDLSVHIDYLLFLDNDSDVDLTIAWVNALYTQVSALFSIHNIDLQISEIIIWDIPDPYAAYPNISQVLTGFGEAIKDDYIGDVAQLLTGRSIGGGKAYLDKICHSYDPTDHSGPYALSASIDIEEVQSTSYSFSTYVTAHELGHVVGSPHNHACVWGSNYASSLDNCFAPEGSCSLGPPTNDGGSIMSYCFLNPDIGINYDHGFGEEPGALMYTKIYNASCNNCIAGTACDDGDNCTMNDQLDEDCNCIGVLLDHNMNNVCDLTEPCEPIVNADTITNAPIAVLASDMILSSTNVNEFNTFSSGAAVEFFPGFEVGNNKTFQVYNSGCDESGN